MKLCILERPGHIVVCERPDPVAGPGDLVIRVEAALTCGTDLKAYRRGHPKMPCPTPFGHEFSGRVVAVGKGAERFPVGTAVMSANTGPCGRCFYCERDQQNLCETLMEEMILGAYAEYLRIPSRVVRANVYAKPDGLPFEQAALLEPLSSVCFGLSQVPAAARHAKSLALVIGAGPIGLLWLVALKSTGFGRVVVAGRRPKRVSVARELGADATAAAGDDLAEIVRASSGGRGADLVVECTGLPEVWEQAPGHARKGGSVVLFGGCAVGTRAQFDTYRLHYDGVQITSPFHFRPVDVAVAHRLLCRDVAAWGRLVTARARLEDVPGLFAGLAGGSDDVKCAVLPHAGSSACV
jgi:L-iditol 2-dehydrogenase